MLSLISKYSPPLIVLILFAVVFILLSLGYLNNVQFQENFAIEPFLLLLISTLVLITLVKSKTALPIKLPEFIFLFFIIYISIKNLLTNTIDISSISYLFFFIILYCGLKFLYSANSILLYSFTLLLALSIILFTYLAFVIYHCYFKNETLTNFFIPNKSIFSILLASQIAFIMPLYLHYKTTSFRLINWGFVAIVIASVLLLGFTKGRGGWLGLILALVFIIYQYLSNKKIKKIILFLFIPFYILIFSMLFWYKSGSSGGRMLIYKISAGVLKDNWLWGIGHGQFKVKYNEYQAAYFAFNNIDSKEALLADNSIYAFNDFFQVVIENGIFAFLIMVVLLFFLVIQIKKGTVNSSDKHLFTAAVASLICIITGSLFSYSLQIFPIIIQATLCLAIINSFSTTQKLQIEISTNGQKISRAVLLLLSSLLFMHFCFYFSYQIKSKQAYFLKRSGFKQKAIIKYAALNNSYIKDGSVLYLYAQELYYSNQLQLSAQVLKNTKKYYSSNEVYKLSATIERELQNFEQAERDYKTAVYMVPNRMISRNELLNFYIERKDTANAIYWANSIINMPVKIPSQTTSGIQKKVKEILLKLNR